MKEKIAEILKNKFFNLGLSKEALLGVASFLEKTITKEEEINSYIEQPFVEEFLKNQQRDLDKIRNEKSLLLKEYEEYKTKHPEEKPIDVPTPPATQKNEELEALKTQFAEIQKRLADADKRNLRTQIESQVAETLRTKGCTNETLRGLVMGRLAIADDATLESVGKIAEDGLNQYNGLYKQLYGTSPIPPSGDGDMAGGYKKGMFDGVVNELVSQGKLPNDQK